MPFGGEIGLFSDNDVSDNNDNDDNNNDKIVNQHTEMKWLEALRKKVNSDFLNENLHI